MNVVVVESPAKARTINKYLGSDYHVLPSYGHVRDLPAKDGSVRPDEDFAMTYVADPKSAKHLKAIRDAMVGATALYLATDPDREGEAISWHVMEALRGRKKSLGVPVKRVVFNAITKNAVLEAMQHPRDVDMALVNAQQARRALDYLVGFSLSPVLWRKLPGARSAGRVQSVALRLICEREIEIESFDSQEYWSITGSFRGSAGAPFGTRMTHLRGKKLEKFSLVDQAAADDAVVAAKGGSYTVGKLETRRTRRHPAPPFTTSTLQQEAARKLGFSAKRTMQVAQRLYEGVDLGGERVGLITYMRTDGVTIVPEIVNQVRTVIGKEFGPRYLPAKQRFYKTKSKNAQEAHEAIRPTDAARRPQDLQSYLNPEQMRLYELIWKRTVASQMQSAELDKTGADLVDAGGAAVFRATGQVVVFDGFLRLYQEGRDPGGKNANAGKSSTVKLDDDDARLPALAEGERVDLLEVKPEQQFTRPPPRFTEASLVKRLEELGIGRPSTYASILSTLRDRSYVVMDKKRFVPEEKGRLVTAFLESFFERYVEYDFTANLEARLDQISAGEAEWKDVLREFWVVFHKAVEDTKELRIKNVLDALETILGPHVFRVREDGKDPRACRQCEGGTLSLKLGRYGAFVGCSNYPECKFTRPLVSAAADDSAPAQDGPVELGVDPESGKMVTLRQGPYGPYVQLGEQEPEPEPTPEEKKAAEEKAAKAAARAAAKAAKTGKPAPKPKRKPRKKSTMPKPKRTSLPKGTNAADVDLAQALSLLSLPRVLGTHPETGAAVSAGIGRYGPYVESSRVFANLGKDQNVLTVTLPEALELLAAKRRRAPAELKALGNHPADGAPIKLLSGRYGPYVSHGGVNATLPKGVEAEAVTVEQAVQLLADRAARKGKKPAKKAKKARKKTAKKAAKKTAKKSTRKKAAKKTAKKAANKTVSK